MPPVYRIVPAITAAFINADVNTKNNFGLARVLRTYGGEFSFVKITFAKGATEYKLDNKLLFLVKSYTGHEDARVIVKNESGAGQVLKLFGGIIEYQGRYKIMSFNVKS